MREGENNIFLSCNNSTSYMLTKGINLTSEALKEALCFRIKPVLNPFNEYKLIQHYNNISTRKKNLENIDQQLYIEKTATVNGINGFHGSG